MIGTGIVTVIVVTTGKYLRVFRISHRKGIATMINATTEIAGMTVTGATIETGAMIGSFISVFLSRELTCPPQ